ncbi:MAG: hypothetical protein LBD03_05490 [Methanobrevibacter sp.]|nr:hypothetical protein [Candidatus Methanovirga procula]
MKTIDRLGQKKFKKHAPMLNIMQELTLFTTTGILFLIFLKRGYMYFQ